jgi:hypothetical protein
MRGDELAVDDDISPPAAWLYSTIGYKDETRPRLAVHAPTPETAKAPEPAPQSWRDRLPLF